MRIRWLVLLLALLATPITAWGKPALVVYPGSFDPPHQGHVTELDQAMVHLRARFPDGAKGLVLPNHDRPAHLPGPFYVFDKAQRHALSTRSFAPIAGVEVARPPGDDVSSLDQLTRAVAPYRDTHEIFLLVGVDAYEGLAKWPHASSVLRGFNLLVSHDRSPVGGLPRPGRVLGALGRGYAARGAQTPDLFQSARTGRTIEYLPTTVPRIRSYPLFLDLFQGRSVASRLTPGARRLLARPALAATVEIGAVLGEHLGPGAALDVLEDDELARGIARLGTPGGPGVGAIAAALAQKARERGRPVGVRTQVANLRRLSASRELTGVRPALAARTRTR